jgi:broad specificity phosphatase PhoE
VTFPEHLQRAIDGLDDDVRAILLVRHAERGGIVDVSRHEEVLLTPAGHEAARAAGRWLASKRPPGRVLHSPVERCGETARGIVAGVVEATGGHRLEHGAHDMLGAHYVRDRDRGHGYAQRHGWGFLRAWLDGQLPDDVFQSRAAAATAQVRAVVELARAQPRGLDVMVTHDWNVALVREEFLGLKHESWGWPGFLDGLLIVVDGDKAHLRVDVHTATLDGTVLNA